MFYAHLPCSKGLLGDTGDLDLGGELLVATRSTRYNKNILFTMSSR